MLPTDVRYLFQPELFSVVFSRALYIWGEIFYLWKKLKFIT